MDPDSGPAANMRAPDNDGQVFGEPPTIQTSLPANSSPEFLVEGFSYVIEFIQTYGWLMVFVAAVMFFVWTRVRDRFYALREEMTSRREAEQTDPAVLASRQEAMAAARERLQRANDEKSAVYAAKQQEEEERKRQERIEDWDRHRRGLGYRSRGMRTSGQEDEEKKPPSGGPRRRPARPDSGYNPLMGGGGVCYRPSRSRPTEG